MEDRTVTTVARSDLERIDRGRWRLFISRDIQGTELARALPGGDIELCERYPSAPVKSAATARVLRFSVEIGGVGHTVYYKEFLSRSVWDTLKHVVRASRARRASVGSALLAARGFNVPETLAFGEKRSALWLHACFLLTLGIEPAETVLAVLSKDANRTAGRDLETKRSLIRALGETVGRMHRNGIVHGDLRLGNVLARREDGLVAVLLPRQRADPAILPAAKPDFDSRTSSRSTCFEKASPTSIVSASIEPI